MSSAERQRASLPPRLASIVLQMFSGDDDIPDRLEALDLFQQFLLLSSYDRAFAIELITLARSGAAAWPMRRAAVLMLEHLLLKLDPDEAAERDFLLSALAVKRPGQGDKVDHSVLFEGFTATDSGRFFAELRQRLLRLERIHARLKGTRTSAAALRDFIFTSSKDCKLSLARYLWSPREVARNILDQVRSSNALSDPSAFQEELVDEEARTALSSLPPFERKLHDELFDSTRAFWVAESTPSELNSLVEYPINTVVLVIKPPGSDVEIEVKRAGVRGPNPLTALYSMNGGVVPPSHHLYGGSMGHLLRWEARHGSLLSRVYRAVHGSEASIARILSINFIYGIPVDDGEKHILNYFSDSASFGEGFEEMKADMRRAARALRSGDWVPPLSSDGIGLSAHFLGQAAPSQAIIAGSTSFRLDRTAAYLLDKGPGLYFTEGLRKRYTREDARRFADEVLEEVLGIYVPPEQPYSSHRQYVEAALAMPANRERADRTFMSMIRQIGLLWGTIMGVRGFSNGESFVARNVGLKSVWQDGQWTARLIFMDHDALFIVGKKTDNFYPSTAIPGMINDANHIFGSRSSGRSCPWKGDVDCLCEIYAIDETLALRGLKALHAALAEAYSKTRTMMERNPIAKTLFTGVFITRLRDWDHFVATYLDARHNEKRVKRWEKQMRTLLASKRYSDSIVNEYFNAVKKHAAFLSEFDFLFTS